MPTYQYQCTECGETLEAQQSFTDDALTVCPHCSGRLRKVFNAVGVVFKGSGFYRNDSRQTASTGESKKTSTKEGAKEGAKESASSSDSSKSSSDSSSGSSSSSNSSSSSAPVKKSGSDSAA